MPVAPTPDGTNPATNSFSSFAATYGGGMPQAGAGASYASPTSTTPPPIVYLGMQHTSIIGDHDYEPKQWMQHPSGYGKPQQNLALIDQAMSKFDKMSVKEQRNMLRLLAIGGLTSSFIPMDKVDDYVKESTLDEGRDAYKTLLETASDYYVNGGLAVTPDDVLKSRIAYRLKGVGVDWDGNMNGFDGGVSKAIEDAATPAEEDNTPKPGTYTTTSKAIDFMNPQDAKNLVRSTLQDQLGRDPTQGEYEDFLSAVHAAEASNPSTQTTTSTYTLDKNDQLRLDDQSTTSHQGIGTAGLQQMAYDKAQRQPSWAEWQAMGTYAPALFAALGSTVPGT